MLKRPIKYKDFDDQDVEEEFYFNISEAEIIELEHEHKGGMSGWLEELVKIEDNKRLFAELKNIVLLSYGEKSPDGKQFVKSPEIRAGFESHAAYNALMYEIFSDEGNAAAFLTGVFPERVRKEIAENAAKRAAKDAGADSPAEPKPPLPPTPPTPPTT